MSNLFCSKHHLWDSSKSIPVEGVHSFSLLNSISVCCCMAISWFIWWTSVVFRVCGCDTWHIRLLWTFLYVFWSTYELITFEHPGVIEKFVLFFYFWIVSGFKKKIWKPLEYISDSQRLVNWLHDHLINFVIYELMGLVLRYSDSVSGLESRDCVWLYNSWVRSDSFVLVFIYLSAP